MPTAPTTLTIAGYIQQLITPITFSALSDGSTKYKTINFGAIKDYTDLVPCCEIELRGDGTHRQAVGGKIRDQTDFLIRSTVAYNAASSSTEADIAQLRDAITPVFHTHATLGQNALTTGICDNRIKANTPRFVWALRNGVWWRMHEFQITVTMEYQVQIVP